MGKSRLEYLKENPDGTYTCTKCDQDKKPSEFNKEARRANGLTARCSDCTLEDDRNRIRTHKPYYTDEVVRQCKECSKVKPVARFVRSSKVCRDCVSKKQAKRTSQTHLKNELDHSIRDEKGKFIGFSEEVHSLIQDNVIGDRLMLWRYIGGRSNEKQKWVEDNGILVPEFPNKQTLIRVLKSIAETKNRLPKTSDVGSMYVNWSFKLYGSWNDALREVFGTSNIKIYSSLSEEELYENLHSFIKENDRLPTKHEFSGKHYPSHQTYFTRFGVKPWSEVLNLLVDPYTLNRLKAKHGMGYSSVKDGVCYYSRGEEEIGLFLNKIGMSFQKEVKYSEDYNFLFDFFLPEHSVYIEYYGLETEEYLQKIDTKRELYGNRDVIEIFKAEGITKTLKEELQKRNIIND